MPARVKQLVRRLGRTGVGKNLIHASVLRDPSTMRFPNVEQWPPDVRGFEDLAFLFSSNQLNHGVASLQIDEAALLYRLARDATSGPFVEIGRFKGGSTFTFASALPQGVELWSYDLHVALRPDMPGDQLDAELRGALERYGIDHKVHLDRRRLAQGRAAVAGGRAALHRRRSFLRGRARRLRPLECARQARRASALPRRRRQRRLRQRLSRRLARRRRGRPRRRLGAAARRRLDRALHARVVDAADRRRPQLERRSGHARGAGVARRRRDDLCRQRLDRRVGRRRRGAVSAGRADPHRRESRLRRRQQRRSAPCVRARRRVGVADQQRRDRPSRASRTRLPARQRLDPTPACSRARSSSRTAGRSSTRARRSTRGSATPGG